MSINISHVKTNGVFNPRCRSDLISMNTWKDNITNVDTANHIAFLRGKLMKRRPHLSAQEIETHIKTSLGPTKYYDRGRA